MKRAAELDSLIDEMTVDAYNDEEQLAGFLVVPTPRCGPASARRLSA